MQLSETAVFWIVVYAAMLSVAALWVFVRYQVLHQRRKELTWDIHTEYIDVSEFSNRNIPLRIIYMDSQQPRWLWATYLTLRNTGSEDILSSDSPDKQAFVAGAPGARYIGFNKLVSDKAKVALNPLFRGEDVAARIEFDRLGPGDEVLVSLLFIADEKQRVELEGSLFGAYSHVRSGYFQRMANWRALWWLVLGVIIAGALASYTVYHFMFNDSSGLLYQMGALLVIYFAGLATAAVLLRPIYNWQQLLDRFGEPGERRRLSVKQLRFLFWLDRDV